MRGVESQVEDAVMGSYGILSFTSSSLLFTVHFNREGRLECLLIF